MPDEALKPALRKALRVHEIGDDTPYRLTFAGKDHSGGSFGFMQGDLAAGQSEARQTFQAALQAANFSNAEINDILAKVGVPVHSNPLSAALTARIDAALLASRDLVDQMDEKILGKVYVQIDKCSAHASAQGRTIAGKALLYMAMWINMTGPPSKLLTWIDGGDPELTHHIPPAQALIDSDAMETYLEATKYYTDHPGNLPHLRQSAAAGVALLPHA